MEWILYELQNRNDVVIKFANMSAWHQEGCRLSRRHVRWGAASSESVVGDGSVGSSSTTPISVLEHHAVDGPVCNCTDHNDMKMSTYL